MKCKKCNVEIQSDGLNCPNCGKSLMELKSLGLLEKNSTEDVYVNKAIQSEEVKSESVEIFSTDSEEVFEVNENKISQKEALEIFGADEDLKITKSRKSIIPLIGVIVAVILFLGLGYLVYLKYKPKLIFKSVIESSIKMLSSGNKINFDTMSLDYDIKINMSGNSSNNELYNFINKLSFDGQIDYDFKNDRSSIKINSKYGNSELINVDSIVENNNVYLLLKNIYDKHIKYEIGDVKTEKFYEKDVDIVLRKFGNVLNQSLKMEYFKSEKIDGLNKTTIKLTEKESLNIFKDILNQLRDDEEFMNSFSKMISNSVDDAKTLFANYLEEIDKELDKASDSKYSELSLYTKQLTNEIKKVEIVEDKEKLTLSFDEEKNVTIIYDNNGEVVTVKTSMTKTGESNKIVFQVLDGDETLNLVINYSVKYDSEVNIPKVSNSIDYDSITDEDMIQIVEAVMSQEGVQKLLEDSGLGSVFFGSGIDDINLSDSI